MSGRRPRPRPRPRRGPRTGSDAARGPSSGAPAVARRELDEATPHAQLFLDRLRRAHLSLAGVAALAGGGLLAALPLVALALPALDDDAWLGVPWPVLLLLVPYPLLVALAWLYVRRADALDEAFLALVAEDEELEPGPPDGPGAWDDGG